MSLQFGEFCNTLLMLFCGLTSGTALRSLTRGYPDFTRHASGKQLIYFVLGSDARAVRPYK